MEPKLNRKFDHNERDLIKACGMIYNNEDLTEFQQKLSKGDSLDESTTERLMDDAYISFLIRLDRVNPDMANVIEMLTGLDFDGKRSRFIEYLYKTIDPRPSFAAITGYMLKSAIREMTEEGTVLREFVNELMESLNG